MDDEFETLSLFPEDRSRLDRAHVRPKARRLAVLVAGLAVLTGFAVASWNSSPAPGPAPASPPAQQPPAAYLPGGSVYAEQVPHLLNWATAYGPGSSTYASQVPPAAR
jgi:hypothetical protein